MLNLQSILAVLNYSIYELWAVLICTTIDVYTRAVCQKLNRVLSLFYKTQFSLTNFMCQMYFDRVNDEFLANLSKNLNLYG